MGGPDNDAYHGWKKFEFPQDMITSELQNKKMTLSTQQLTQIYKNRLVGKMVESGRVSDSMSEKKWKSYFIKVEAKQLRSKLTDEFIDDFIRWLQGRSIYNAKEYDRLERDETGQIINRKVVPGCPWGNKPLTFLPGVAEFIDQGVDRRDTVIKYITKLKMKKPQTLEEAWIYYKYILREAGLDETGIKEVEEYAVFDDPGKGPGGENGLAMPSPPLYDPAAYQRNFRVNFDIALQDPQFYVHWLNSGHQPMWFMTASWLNEAATAGIQLPARMRNVYRLGPDTNPGMAAAVSYRNQYMSVDEIVQLNMAPGDKNSYPTFDYDALSREDKDIVVSVAMVGIRAAGIPVPPVSPSPRVTPPAPAPPGGGGGGAPGGGGGGTPPTPLGRVPNIPAPFNPVLGPPGGNQNPAPPRGGSDGVVYKLSRLPGKQAKYYSEGRANQAQKTLQALLNNPGGPTVEQTGSLSGLPGSPNFGPYRRSPRGNSSPPLPRRRDPDTVTPLQANRARKKKNRNLGGRVQPGNQQQAPAEPEPGPQTVPVPVPIPGPFDPPATDAPATPFPEAPLPGTGRYTFFREEHPSPEAAPEETKAETPIEEEEEESEEDKRKREQARYVAEVMVQQSDEDIEESLRHALEEGNTFLFEELTKAVAAKQAAAPRMADIAEPVLEQGINDLTLVAGVNDAFEQGEVLPPVPIPKADPLLEEAAQHVSEENREKVLDAVTVMNPQEATLVQAIIAETGGQGLVEVAKKEGHEVIPKTPYNFVREILGKEVMERLTTPHFTNSVDDFALQATLGSLYSYIKAGTSLQQYKVVDPIPMDDHTRNAIARLDKTVQKSDVHRQMVLKGLGIVANFASINAEAYRWAARDAMLLPEERAIALSNTIKGLGARYADIEDLNSRILGNQDWTYHGVTTNFKKQPAQESYAAAKKVLTMNKAMSDEEIAPDLSRADKTKQSAKALALHSTIIDAYTYHRVQTAMNFYYQSGLDKAMGGDYTLEYLVRDLHPFSSKNNEAMNNYSRNLFLAPAEGLPIGFTRLHTDAKKAGIDMGVTRNTPKSKTNQNSKSPKIISSKKNQPSPVDLHIDGYDQDFDVTPPGSPIPQVPTDPLPIHESPIIVKSKSVVGFVATVFADVLGEPLPVVPPVKRSIVPKKLPEAHAIPLGDDVFPVQPGTGILGPFPEATKSERRAVVGGERDFARVYQFPDEGIISAITQFNGRDQRNGHNFITGLADKQAIIELVSYHAQEVHTAGYHIELLKQITPKTEPIHLHRHLLDAWNIFHADNATLEQMAVENFMKFKPQAFSSVDAKQKFMSYAMLIGDPLLKRKIYEAFPHFDDAPRQYKNLIRAGDTLPSAHKPNKDSSFDEITIDSVENIDTALGYLRYFSYFKRENENRSALYDASIAYTVAHMENSAMEFLSQSQALEEAFDGEIYRTIEKYPGYTISTLAPVYGALQSDAVSDMFSQLGVEGIPEQSPELTMQQWPSFAFGTLESAERTTQPTREKLTKVNNFTMLSDYATVSGYLRARISELTIDPEGYELAENCIAILEEVEQSLEMALDECTSGADDATKERARQAVDDIRKSTAKGVYGITSLAQSPQLVIGAERHKVIDAIGELSVMPSNATPEQLSASKGKLYDTLATAYYAGTLLLEQQNLEEISAWAASPTAINPVSARWNKSVFAIAPGSSQFGIQHNNLQGLVRLAQSATRFEHAYRTAKFGEEFARHVSPDGHSWGEDLVNKDAVLGDYRKMKKAIGL